MDKSLIISFIILDAAHHQVELAIASSQDKNQINQ